MIFDPLAKFYCFFPGRVKSPIVTSQSNVMNVGADEPLPAVLI